MINNQLLEEIIFVSEKDKYLDKILIRRIIESIIEQTDDKTKNRFNDIFFCDTNWNGNVVCTCDGFSGNITIDYDKLIKQYKKSKTLSILMSNLDMTSDFLHEIDHLQEESKKKLLNFESLLLSYSSFDLFENLAMEKLKSFRRILNKKMYKNILEKIEDQIYLKIYNKIPSERFASINAYKNLFNSICSYEGFNEKYKEAFNYINDTYINQYYLGYEKIDKDNYFNVPLLDYLEFIKMPNLLNDFDFYSQNLKKFLKLSSKKFSIEERMLYGLPVTLEETEKLDKKLIFK